MEDTPSLKSQIHTNHDRDKIATLLSQTYTDPKIIRIHVETLAKITNIAIQLASTTPTILAQTPALILRFPK